MLNIALQMVHVRERSKPPHAGPGVTPHSATSYLAMAMPSASAPVLNAAASASPTRVECTKRAAASRLRPLPPTQSAHATPTARCREPGARDDGSDARSPDGLAG